MSTSEKVIFKHRTSAGDTLLYPITTADNIEGLTEAIQEQAVTDTELTSALSSKAESEHTHEQSEVNGLTDALSSKADIDHTHSDLHSHDNKTILDSITDAKISSWDSAATGTVDAYTKSESDARYSLASHTHEQSEVNGLTDALESLTSSVNGATKVYLESSEDSEIMYCVIEI